MAPVRSTRSRANRTKEYRTSGRRPSRNPFIIFRSDVAKTNWRVSIPNASSLLWKEMTEEEKFVWKAHAERADFSDTPKEESQIYRLQRLEGIKKRVWAMEEEEAESRVGGIDERPEDSNQSPDCPSSAATPSHSWGVDSAETSRCSSEDTTSDISTTNTTIPCSTPPPDALDVPLYAPGGAPSLGPSPSACSLSLPLPLLPDAQSNYWNSTYPSATNPESTLDTLPYLTLDNPSLMNQDEFRTFSQNTSEEMSELSLTEFIDPDPLNHQLYASIDKISDEEVKYWADYFLSINTQFEPVSHSQDPAQAEAEDLDLSTVDCSTVDWQYIQETFPEAYDIVFGEPYLSNAEDLDYDCSTSDLDQGYDSW